MGVAQRSRRLARFGPFEVDLQTGELRRHGLKVRLQEHPFRVLALLLGHPGELVTREQLQKAIWPKDTFVDFDEGLDAAIYRLRRALGDSGDHPRFIETLARRGYRFIGQVEEVDPSADTDAHWRRSSGSTRVGNGPAAAETEPPMLASPESAPLIHPGRLTRTLKGTALVTSITLLLVLLLNLAGSRADRSRTAKRNRTTGAIRSLVVLPLENLSGDPSQDYFADGMTEALTTDLGRLGQLRVISRTSAMHYKGTHKTLPEIARELGVDAVIEGGVARFGDRLRITAQLIQARTDQHLWANSYEGDARDALALQDEVARSIAERVMIELSPEERSRLTHARLIDPPAEEEYFRGRAEWSTWTKEGLETSIGYFDQAIQADPDYAEAWAGLARAYDLLGVFGYIPRRRTLAQTRAAAEKALELDETLSEAHVSLASAMWPLLGTTLVSARQEQQACSAAEKELRLAVKLNANDALAHQWLGYHLVAVGRFDEAIAEMKQARELDPLSPNTQNSLGAAYYWAGRYDEAMQQFREVPDPDANSERRHQRMARIYERQGTPKRAIAEMIAALRFAGEQHVANSVERKFRSSGYREARKLALKDDIEEKERKARKLGVPVAAMHIAGDYALLGDTEQSLHWLELAVRQDYAGIAYLKVDDRFQTLRPDPRFKELLLRVGLTP